ncbi:hypothetical protein IMZ48_15890, partial [Candidatus Bathyarchaeota archaeon]|nr:hypothetical protein [Candidatus Bathyarchaeota archaeon]
VVWVGYWVGISADTRDFWNTPSLLHEKKKKKEKKSKKKGKRKNQMLSLAVIDGDLSQTHEETETKSDKNCKRPFIPGVYPDDPT